MRLAPRALLAEGERFRPFRSVVARYCWQAVALHRGHMVLPDNGAQPDLNQGDAQ